MNIYVYSYGVVLSIMVHQAYGFIYEVKIMRRWDDRRGQYHYFIGYSDFHDKSHSASAQQVVDIQDFVATFLKKDIHIITEDLSSEGGGRASCGPFYINSRGGVLGGIADLFRGKNISTANVEYRYCRVASLGPVINALQDDLSSFSSTNRIQVADLCTEIDRQVELIDSYDDGHTLSLLYKKELKDVAREMKKAQLNSFKSLSVADYLARLTTSDNRIDYLKHLLTFDSALLDIKMAHQIVNNSDKKGVIAIAGGSHIARVCTWLKTVGYQEYYATPIRYAKERSLKRCLGSNTIEGSFCVKPKAVDLKKEVVIE